MNSPELISQSESSPTSLLNHLPAIFWQRRLYITASILLLFAAGTIAAFTLPTLYRSTATLLVQSQELPSTLVQAPTAGAIEQRVASIRERVLSRGDLIALVEQNNLYPEERREQPMSRVVEKMRQATGVSALAGDIGQSTGTQKSTVAIVMSFDYPDPVKAQTVLQSFVASFLSIDSQSVEDQATLTVRFLQDQADKLQAQITQIEGELTTLKANNGAALASSGAPALIDTGSFGAQITSLQNENRQLIARSQQPAEHNDALGQAEAALAALQAQYSDTHPDVVQARARVAQLRQSSPQRPDVAAQLREQIAANNQAIQSLMAQRDASLARVNSAIAGQARAPAILEQAMQLENRASVLRAQYQQVSQNLLAAQNSARMATEQRSERLTLVEPATLPDQPYSPNRPLLMAAGAAAGLLFGMFLAFVLEWALKPVRSARQLEQQGFPVLGVVPLFKAKKRALNLPLFKWREKRVA